MTHKQTIINAVDELVTIYNKLGGIVDIESIEQGQSIIDAYRHLREAIILLDKAADICGSCDIGLKRKDCSEYEYRECWEDAKYDTDREIKK